MFDYSNEIYNTRSAEVIVPIIINLFHPKKVIDVGCGNGSWLKVFEDNLISIEGIEGNHIVNTNLLVDIKNIVIHDLEKPITIDKRFDLAVCLEVAEHLSEYRAPTFIADLTKLSDVIIFSAAVPYQGGYQHINEKYLSYWIRIFKENNFRCFDLLRPLVCNNENVLWWYKQNMFVFINSSSNFCKNYASHEVFEGYDFVIRELYESKIIELRSIYSGEKSLKFYFKLLKNKFIRKIKNAVRRYFSNYLLL